MQRRLYLVLCLGLFCSCATKSVPLVSQPQVNALVASSRFAEANKSFQNKSAYGPKNELLYLLDRGLVSQISGGYAESIQYFAKAKIKIDELYTKSLTNLAATWLVNDTNAPYRGEASEHVWVNMFQALNYAALGNISEALVEARDVNRKLTILNDLHQRQGDYVYRDDAFARLLSGILYESKNDRQDLNDALIAYRKALNVYRDDFHKNTSVEIPYVLRENILAAAQELGFEEFKDYQRQFPDVKFVPVPEKEKKAVVYFVHYNGLSPVKHAGHIPVPIPDGPLTQMAFPKYSERDFDIRTSTITAQRVKGSAFSAQTEVIAKIEAIAIRQLEAAKHWLYAKSFLRPAGKFLLEKGLESKVEREHGDGSGWAVRGAASLYNLFSEQADTRSWQTLPAEVRIARLILSPGDYELQADFRGGSSTLIESKKLGSLSLKAGETRFIIVRTVY